MSPLLELQVTVFHSLKQKTENCRLDLWQQTTKEAMQMSSVLSWAHIQVSLSNTSNKIIFSPFPLSINRTAPFCSVLYYICVSSYLQHRPFSHFYLLFPFFSSSRLWHLSVVPIKVSPLVGLQAAQEFGCKVFSSTLTQTLIKSQCDIHSSII